MHARDAHIARCKAKVQALAHKKPTKWAENVPGVKRNLNTTDKVVALTLDLCGRPGDSLDYRIVDYLVAYSVPTTFFVSCAWIAKHPKHFEYLKQHPFFDFQNHGRQHIPCSIAGNVIYDMTGTRNLDELLEEVEQAAVDLTPFLVKSHCITDRAKPIMMKLP